MTPAQLDALAGVEHAATGRREPTVAVVESDGVEWLTLAHLANGGGR